MKNVLVTGAGGFIGKSLATALWEAGYRVLELGSDAGDIADAATLERFQDLEIDFVFHLAGRTYVPDAWREPADFQRVNVHGTVNVLEMCRKKKIPLTYVSAYLYGIPTSLPIRESDPLKPNNPYALSKMLAESVCEFYAAWYDVAVTIVRPFNIYGPGQKGHFLIPEILAKVQAGEPVRVMDLAPKRDYLYLDDLVEGLLCTLSPAPGCRVYNMGYGSSMSVSEIIDAIQAVAGTSLEVLCGNHVRMNEIPDVYADISKAFLELGWQPKVAFADGVAKIFQKDLGHE